MSGTEGEPWQTRRPEPGDLVLFEGYVALVLSLDEEPTGTAGATFTVVTLLPGPTDWEVRTRSPGTDLKRMYMYVVLNYSTLLQRRFAVPLDNPTLRRTR